MCINPGQTNGRGDQPDKVFGKQVRIHTQGVEHIVPNLEQQLGIFPKGIATGVSPLVRAELQEHWGRKKEQVKQQVLSQ